MLGLNTIQKVSASFAESDAPSENWAKVANRVKMARSQGYHWIQRQNLAHICPFGFSPYSVKEHYIPLEAWIRVLCLPGP